MVTRIAPATKHTGDLEGNDNAEQQMQGLCNLSWSSIVILYLFIKFLEGFTIQIRINYQAIIFTSTSLQRQSNQNFQQNKSRLGAKGQQETSHNNNQTRWATQTIYQCVSKAKRVHINSCGIIKASCTDADRNVFKEERPVFTCPPAPDEEIALPEGFLQKMLHITTILGKEFLHKSLKLGSTLACYPQVP